MDYAAYADAALFHDASVCTAVLEGGQKDLDVLLVYIVTEPICVTDSGSVGMTGLAWVTIDTMIGCEILIAGEPNLATTIVPGDSLVLLDVRLAGEPVSNSTA
jgi:hypothetical protein